ncbi:MAG: hypothetical protein MRJ92_09655 [Nitrospira sp.]|nr:hypothetical protein [Nitrospira sp.]
MDLTLLESTGSYQLTNGMMHNLSTDRLIKDHGDVANKEVAFAVVSAISAA